MSVATRANELVPIGRTCFHCGIRIVMYPFVVWAGSTSRIHFHPDCATRFGLAFARDAWQANHEVEHATR